jgi:hypothetical protein
VLIYGIRGYPGQMLDRNLLGCVLQRFERRIEAVPESVEYSHHAANERIARITRHNSSIARCRLDRGQVFSPVWLLAH